MGNQAEAEELQLSTFGVSRGLSWVREDVVGSKLNPSWYFEGGRGNNKDDLSGIYLDFDGADPLVGTTGQLWYNPTSHIRGDSK